jgi:hypothetical protein
MITINVAINGTVIATRSANRIKEPDEKGKATYKTDCNTIIKHNPDDGFKPLVQKMIEAIHE